MKMKKTVITLVVIVAILLLIFSSVGCKKEELVMENNTEIKLISLIGKSFEFTSINCKIELFDDVGYYTPSYISVNVVDTITILSPTKYEIKTTHGVYDGIREIEIIDNINGDVKFKDFTVGEFLPLDANVNLFDRDIFNFTVKKVYLTKTFELEYNVID